MGNFKHIPFINRPITLIQIAKLIQNFDGASCTDIFKMVEMSEYRISFQYYYTIWLIYKKR